jgi:phage shock protein A
MALLERVATLIRANLNELVDRAEDPEKMIKQVILDMQNQFMQVKTQVAIALADLHLLEKKQQENTAREDEWMRKAQFAVSKGDDQLARAGLDRAMSYKQLAANFVEQIEDEKSQVEVLKDALHALARKIQEAEGQAEMLIAKHRRAKAVGRAAEAHQNASSTDKAGAFQRMSTKVLRQEAITQAAVEMSGCCRN